jgi:hypothetical protein
LDGEEAIPGVVEVVGSAAEAAWGWEIEDVYGWWWWAGVPDDSYWEWDRLRRWRVWI